MKPCNVISKTATVLLLPGLVRYIVCSESKSITGSNCMLKFMLLNCTVVFEVVPNGQVLVCPGRQFLITCSSNSSMFLQWNVTIPYYNVTNTRVISAFNNVGHVLHNIAVISGQIKNYDYDCTCTLACMQSDNFKSYCSKQHY